MFLSLIFILLLVTAFLSFRKYRKSSLILGGLTAILFITSSYGLTPQLLLGKLQKSPRLNNFQWGDHNIIVVLGSGVSVWPEKNQITPTQAVATRYLEGLRQYHLCKKSNNSCTLLFSGGDPRGIGTPEALILQRLALDTGISAGDVLIEDKSYDTEQNAFFTAALLKDYRYDQLILVTSGYHLPRSSKWFERAGLQFTPAPADHLEAQVRLVPSARHLFYLDLTLHEIGGLIEFYLKTLF